MKNFKILIFGLSVALFTSCTSVESGHKGVAVTYGKTDMETIYNEGFHGGLHWLWTDMIEYNVKEHTITKKFLFNDIENMEVPLEISLDYKKDPSKVNYLHRDINDVDSKIISSLSSGAKQVVPKYTGVELNINKREEAESLLSDILKKELAEFHIQFVRVRFTDVDIPKEISEIAKQTVVQLGKNELASKMKEEQKFMAEANLVAAQGAYDVEVLNDKTKALKSKPAYLQLYSLENDRIWAESGKSKYGSNNVFGAGTTVIKGLK